MGGARTGTILTAYRAGDRLRAATLDFASNLLIPSSIAGGMGLYLGVGVWRELRRPTDAWLGLPRDRLRDVAYSYVLITPLFFVASLWEFFA